MSDLQIALVAILMMAIYFTDSQIRLMSACIQRNEDGKSLALFTTALLTVFLCIWLVIRLASSWDFN